MPTVLLDIRIEATPLIIGIPFAFVGGLLSFLSPCVLPLVPGYIGYLAGTSVSERIASTRRTLLAHGAAFVLGFSAVFTFFGIAVGQFLSNVQSAQGYIRWVGGVIIILMGLHMLGLIRIPGLHRTIRLNGIATRAGRSRERLGIVAHPPPVPQHQASVERPAATPRGSVATLGRSFVVGVFFAAGWSPCVGPILTGIYGVVGAQPANGGALLFCYSLGLGVPFLVVALLFGCASHLLRRINRYYGAISLVSGSFLILIGILLVTDSFAQLARYAPVITLPGVT